MGVGRCVRSTLPVHTFWHRPSTHAYSPILPHSSNQARTNPHLPEGGYVKDEGEAGDEDGGGGEPAEVEGLEEFVRPIELAPHRPPAPAVLGDADSGLRRGTGLVNVKRKGLETAR